jgi:predicted nucleic acid-binding Zn finger protein
MSYNSESIQLEKICGEASQTKQLTKTHITWLTKLFGNRFKNAQEALSEKKVKKYLFQPSCKVVWIVVGKKREYQIIPLANFCSCEDFYFRVVDNRVYLCYHLLAQKLANALDLFDTMETSDEFYEQLMEKWRTVQIKETKMPKEELKNLRNFVKEVLSNEIMEIHQLLIKAREAGFDVATSKQLATLLSTDSQKRFLCENGFWAFKNHDVKH